MKKDPCVRVENMVVRYGQSRILDRVSFSVNPGEIFIILGGSGSGKSTLMRHMIGLEKPAEGNVFIERTDITRADDAEFFASLRKIGVLFQNTALIGSMSIGENMTLPIREYTNLSLPLIRVIVRMKLSLVGLECYEDHLPSELSGGMKKRAGLARSLALNPAILFLDEPTSGLDPVTAAEIDDLIVHINRSLGTTMIIVSHDLDSIFRTAHRAIMLDKAERTIIAEGDPRRMKENHESPAVRRFFQRAAAGQPADD